MLLRLLLEGLGLGALLVLICALGIRKGAVGMVHLYHEDVQSRAIAQGLITKEQIRKNSLRFKRLCIPGYLASRRGDRESAGFRGWVDALSPAEREEFTQVFFDLLAASRAETLSEFSQSWADSALAVAGAYAALPPAVRRDMLDYLWRFLVNMGTGGKG